MKGGEPMVCPNCGAPLPDTVSMCYSCRMVFKPKTQQIQKPTQSKPMSYSTKHNIQSNISKYSSIIGVAETKQRFLGTLFKAATNSISVSDLNLESVKIL